MNQQTIVDKQFGEAAKAYLTSSVHAQGKDLAAIKDIAKRYKSATILDLGCGAGHVSYAVAAMAKKVIAYDLSEKMLDVVAHSARERKLRNIEVEHGLAEKLPFDDNTFDLVVTRFSAHHWSNLVVSLDEICRVLTPQGTAVIVDIVAPENALNDTLLQTVEILRDASHVRDYSISEWRSKLAYSGFVIENESRWKLVMQFAEWIKRMQTPEVRVDAIRDVFDRAAEESKRYFAVQPDYSFSIDSALFEVRKY